jgi:phospholipase/lecithinase/hemolysin
MKLRDKGCRILAVVLVALFTLAGRPSAHGPEYQSFMTFGDSLADIGNVFILSQVLGIDPAPPPSSAYFEGRFSNGPVAFEYLWQLLSGKAPGQPGSLRAFLASPLNGAEGAVDYAFGGTGTPRRDVTPGGLSAPGLEGQIELYRLSLRGRKPSRRTLFAIVTGANDYRLDAFHQPLPPTESVGNIRDAVATLYEMGARDVMVLNLPDLGLIPANIADPAAATQLSMLHNALLKNALDQLAAQLPKLNLIQVDLFQLPSRLPSGMNFVVPALDFLFPPGPPLPPGFFMSTCLFVDPATCANVPTFNVPGTFVFWDVVHPTTVVHRVLGEYLHERLIESLVD